MTSRAPLLDISELAGRLAERVDDIVAELLPGARNERVLWRVGSLAGEPGGSMVVWRRGVKAGQWCDFSSGEWGDCLDLIAECRFGGNKGEACKYARSWLGLDNLDPARLEQTRREARQRKADADAQAARDEADARRRAQGHWLNGQPIKGTPAERYLRQTRGLEFARLGHWPGAARYTPKLWHAASQRHWPGILWAVTYADGTFATVHRQWLEIRSDGSVDKAPFEAPRAAYCPYRGACIRLWKGLGAKGKPRKSPWKDPPEWMVLGEGAEDGLTAAVARPALPTAAAVSLANLRNVVLPAGTNVILLKDEMAPGGDQEASFDKAVSAFMRQGRRVRVVESSSGKDLNEWLRKTG